MMTDGGASAVEGSVQHLAVMWPAVLESARGSIDVASQ